jgi:hypothetical protein
VKFIGLESFGHVSGQIDVTLEGVGNVDLRNDAHIEAIRFLPGEKALSLAYDFVREGTEAGQVITLEFTGAEITSIEPYLETGVDPGYGHALLFGIGHWADIRGPRIGREGFTVETTTLAVSFYAASVIAKVSPGAPG